jgi:cytochrome c biogenesis protein CcdA
MPLAFLAPLIAILGPILQPVLQAILSAIAESVQDHAEYSKPNMDDDLLGQRLRARIERVWLESDRHA